MTATTIERNATSAARTRARARTRTRSVRGRSRRRSSRCSRRCAADERVGGHAFERLGTIAPEGRAPRSMRRRPRIAPHRDDEVGRPPPCAHADLDRPKRGSPRAGHGALDRRRQHLGDAETTTCTGRFRLPGSSAGARGSRCFERRSSGSVLTPARRCAGRSTGSGARATRPSQRRGSAPDAAARGRRSRARTGPRGSCARTTCGRRTEPQRVDPVARRPSSAGSSVSAASTDTIPTRIAPAARLRKIVEGTSSRPNIATTNAEPLKRTARLAVAPAPAIAATGLRRRLAPRGSARSRRASSRSRARAPCPTSMFTVKIESSNTCESTATRPIARRSRRSPSAAARVPRRPFRRRAAG